MQELIQTKDFVDEELRKMLWDQAIPVQFDLHQLDLALDQENPLPMYLMMYLNKYPCFYFESIHKHFQRYCPPPLNERHIWISYKNQPIQWNVPFGLSLDLLGRESQIPLKMIVNYRRRPIRVLQKIEQDINTTIFKQVLHSMKQACIIKCKKIGLNQFLQQLTKDELIELCECYKGQEFNKFYNFYDQLFDLNLIRKENEMHIPVRIYIKGQQGRLQQGLIMKDVEQTLGDLLRELLPKLDDKVKIRIQGLDVDLNLKARNLFFDLYSPDGFVYIIIKQN